MKYSGELAHIESKPAGLECPVGARNIKNIPFNIFVLKIKVWRDFRGLKLKDVIAPLFLYSSLISNDKKGVNRAYLLQFN